MRRATGLPQLFGLLIVFGVGIVFMMIIFFFSGAHSATAEVAEKDFCDAKTHYILTGWLRASFTNQEVLKEELVIAHQRLQTYHEPTNADFLGVVAWEARQHQLLREVLEEDVKRITGLNTLGLFLRNDNGRTNILLAPSGWPEEQVGVAEITIPGIEQTQTIHLAMRCDQRW